MFNFVLLTIFLVILIVATLMCSNNIIDIVLKKNQTNILFIV